MKKLIKEFKAFISRGSVLDMAVGVIIATAFGKITTSLVNNIIMPVIGWIFGGQSVTDALNVTARPAVLNEAGEVVKEATVIGFGTFVSTIIDFLIIAFVVFIIVKTFNRAHELAKKKEPPKKPEPPKPTTEELLGEILQELRNK